MGKVARAGVKMSAEPMVGGSVEVKTLFPNSFGNTDVVYDPLNMLDLHALNKDVFPHPKWLRESEVKHCRIAMLASIGAFSAQYGLVIPGYEATLKADPVANLNAFFTEQPLAFAQIFLAIGLIEGTSQPGEFWTGNGDREAGNYHFDPTNFWGKQTQVCDSSLVLFTTCIEPICFNDSSGYPTSLPPLPSPSFFPPHFVCCTTGEEERAATEGVEEWQARDDGDGCIYRKSLGESRAYFDTLA